MRSCATTANAATPEAVSAALERLLDRVGRAEARDPGSVQPVLEALAQLNLALAENRVPAESFPQTRAALDRAMNEIGALLARLVEARDGLCETLAALNARGRARLSGAARGRGGRLDVRS
ncbi:MAG: hypothetical protein HY812_12720 [Planctomycetes bacterium]|nr:hypothetical protein [Planctomycetota bacterium]